MGCRVANTLKSLNKACRRRRTESTSTCREKNSRSLSIVTSIGKGETYKLRLLHLQRPTSALGRKIRLRRTRCLSQHGEGVDACQCPSYGGDRVTVTVASGETKQQRTRLKMRVTRCQRIRPDLLDHVSRRNLSRSRFESEK